MTETAIHHERKVFTPEVRVARHSEEYGNPLGENLVKALHEAASYTQQLHDLQEGRETHRDDLMRRRLRWRVREDTVIDRVITLEQDLQEAEKRIGRQTALVRDYAHSFNPQEQRAVDESLSLEAIPEEFIRDKQNAEYYAKQPLTWCQWLSKTRDSSVQQFTVWHHNLLGQEVAPAQAEAISHTFTEFAQGLKAQTEPGGELSPQIRKNFSNFPAVDVVLGSPFDRQLFGRSGYATGEHTVVLNPHNRQRFATVLPHELTHLLGGFQVDSFAVDGFDVFQEATVDYLATIIMSDRITGEYPMRQRELKEVLGRSNVSAYELSQFFAGTHKARNFQELDHHVTSAEGSQVDFGAYVNLWLQNYYTELRAQSAYR